MFNPFLPAMSTSPALRRAKWRRRRNYFWNATPPLRKKFPPPFVSSRPNRNILVILHRPRTPDLVLLTNGIGGMARLCVDLGRVNSKYDCALGANLNPDRARGPPCFRQTPPRLGQTPTVFFRRLISKISPSAHRTGPARRLEFRRQRRRRPHGGNRIARRNVRRQKHRRLPVQPPG